MFIVTNSFKFYTWNTGYSSSISGPLTNQDPPVTFAVLDEKCSLSSPGIERRTYLRVTKLRTKRIYYIYMFLYYFFNCWFIVDSTQYSRYLDLPSLMLGIFFKPPSIRRYPRRIRAHLRIDLATDDPTCLCKQFGFGLYYTTVNKNRQLFANASNMLQKKKNVKNKHFHMVLKTCI